MLQEDPPTRAIFEQILRDEVFHMNYTLTQMGRVSPRRHPRRRWLERLTSIWKGHVRLAAERMKHRGWTPIPGKGRNSLHRGY